MKPSSWALLLTNPFRRWAFYMAIWFECQYLHFLLYLIEYVRGLMVLPLNRIQPSILHRPSKHSLVRQMNSQVDHDIKKHRRKNLLKLTKVKKQFLSPVSLNQSTSMPMSITVWKKLLTQKVWSQCPWKGIHASQLEVVIVEGYGNHDFWGQLIIHHEQRNNWIYLLHSHQGT